MSTTTTTWGVIVSGTGDQHEGVLVRDASLDLGQGAGSLAEARAVQHRYSTMYPSSFYVVVPVEADELTFKVPATVCYAVRAIAAPSTASTDQQALVGRFVASDRFVHGHAAAAPLTAVEVARQSALNHPGWIYQVEAVTLADDGQVIPCAPQYEPTLFVAGIPMTATAVQEVINRRMNEVESARINARNASAAHQSDIDTISEALIEEASRRGWCADFDTFVASLNEDLNLPLRERRKAYTVTATYTVTVEVTVDAAEDEDDACDQARDMIDAADIAAAVRNGEFQEEDISAVEV